MLRKIIALTAGAALLAACSSEPTVQTGESAEHHPGKRDWQEPVNAGTSRTG